MTLQEDKLVTESNLEVIGLLNFLARYSWEPTGISGELIAEASLGGFRISSGGKLLIGADQCMRGSANLNWCYEELCIGPAFTYYVCGLSDWGIDFKGLFATLACPANLHLYDEFGNHVGLNDQGGIELEIPGVEFGVLGDSGYQYFYIPDTRSRTDYHLDVEGLENGTFDLRIFASNASLDSVIELSYLGQPVDTASLAILDLGAGNWVLEQDIDGDSVFESQILPDSINVAAYYSADFSFVSQPAVTVDDLTATVMWETTLPSRGYVSVGTTTDYELGDYWDSTMSQTHSVDISGLALYKEYTCQVFTEDSTGLVILSNRKYFETCECASFCDLNSDGVINPVDAAHIINYAFRNLDARTDIPTCPGDNGDWNCDEIVNPLDVIWCVQYVYRGSGIGPCDPCLCKPYPPENPDDCPPYP